MSAQGEYFSDVEHAGEMTRLLKQARVVTHALGGPFPVSLDLTTIADVLDLACGPGEWVFNVAEAYSHMQVTGVDLSETMIHFSRAISGQVPNAHFRVMDATRSLDFPAASFDLIHARYLFGFMPKSCWPLVLAECRRLLRPGGVIVVTEGEMPTTNKPAVTRYTELFTQALLAVGQSFSADGKQIGIVPVLPRLLAEAGFQPGGSQQHVFDFVTGTPDERAVIFLNNYKTGFLLIKPFLLKAGVTTAREIDTLYSQMLAEVEAPDFSANTLVLRVWSSTPA